MGLVDQGNETSKENSSNLSVKWFSDKEYHVKSQVDQYRFLRELKEFLWSEFEGLKLLQSIAYYFVCYQVVQNILLFQT